MQSINEHYVLNPARVKIDHIVHLQDARYVAAAGVGFLSLCLERGHIRKMAESAVWELLDWLNGPQFILDFGLDHTAAEAYVRAPLRTDVWVQIACPIDLLATSTLPPAHLVSIGFDSIDLLQDNHHLLDRLIQDDYSIELVPTQKLNDLRVLSEALPESVNPVFIQPDLLDESSLAELAQLPAILSLRRWIEMDAYSLDYDRFEQLISEV